MSKRVTNQDLLERVIKLETEFSSIRAGIKWLMAMVGTALAGGSVQFLRSIVTFHQ